MSGLTQEGVKAVSGFVGIFKNEPLSLALIAMNMCLLGFFYFLLSTVSNQREREIGLLYADKKEVRDLLAKCVVPDKRSNWYMPFMQPTPFTFTKTPGAD